MVYNQAVNHRPTWEGLLSSDTSVQYQLPDPTFEQHVWVLADEHAPASAPPLLAGVPMIAIGPPPGPGEPPRSLTINGYNYQRGGVDEAALLRRGKPPETVEDLTRWRTEWLPQVDTLGRRLETFDAASVPAGAWESTIADQDKEFGRVFSGVHLNAVLPARIAVAKFQEAFAKRFGEGRRQDADALLQGFPNRSLDRAAALWDLGRILRANPDLRAALDKRAELPPTPAAREFREKLDAMLKEFGCTTDNGQQDLLTWGEGSPVPMAMLRAYARQEDSRRPRAAAKRQEARRIELEGELRARVKGDPSLAEIVPLLEMAQQLMPNLEDHNLLCDQRLHAAARMRWLSVGRVLVGRGLANAPDDVFFYRRPELFKALEHGEGLRPGELQARRRLQEAYRLTPPPLFLGRAPEGMRPEDAIPDEAQQGRTIRGVAASAGSYRGRARLIEGLAAAATLQEGDILIVRATTPPWTPYFGVIGALVTNSGGALSHSAVVAREFGIPAVVGTRNGTSLVPDGATVTVDGTTGLVIVE